MGRVRCSSWAASSSTRRTVPRRQPGFYVGDAASTPPDTTDAALDTRVLVHDQTVVGADAFAFVEPRGQARRVSPQGPCGSRHEHDDQDHQRHVRRSGGDLSVPRLEDRRRALGRQVERRSFIVVGAVSVR